jgi:hypothetical protein
MPTCPYCQELQRRYLIRKVESVPRVYFRITDNWLELSVRFIAKDHAIGDIKDLMSRDILDEFDKAGIEIASTSMDIVGMPQLRATSLNPSAR